MNESEQWQQHWAFGALDWAREKRERKAPSGVKDDRLDAWSFADALRVDGQD